MKFQVIRILWVCMTGLLVPKTGQSGLFAREIDCGFGGSGIQRAIDSARNGDVLRIRGRCRETLRIEGKNIRLEAHPGAILEAPDTSWSMLPVTTMHPMILVLNSRVEIEGFVIDGRYRADDPEVNGLMGIDLINSGAELIGNRWVRFRHTQHQSDEEVIPIRILHTPAFPHLLSRRAGRVVIEKNRIEDFESNGIFAIVQPHPQAPPPLPLLIRNNEIIGSGPMIQNQNGVQIGGYADASPHPMEVEIEGNLFEGFFSFSGIWHSSGILVTPTLTLSGSALRPIRVECRKNLILSSNTGISLSTSSKSVVVENLIQQGTRGMVLEGNSIHVRKNHLQNLEIGIKEKGETTGRIRLQRQQTWIQVERAFEEPETNARPSSICRGAEGRIR
jgi:hypothetical protein